MSTQRLFEQLFAPLMNQLKQDLTKPRLLTDQVLEQLAGQYNTHPEALASFITEQFPQLEDYAVDLTFSSLFTPTQEESVQYAALLEDAVLSKAELADIKTQLLALNLNTTLRTPAGETHPLLLHEVLLDRFVDRLPLDKPLSQGAFSLIQSKVPSEHQGLANFLSRSSVWHPLWRQALLSGFLTHFGTQTPFPANRFEYLSEFLHTYRPNDLEDMTQKLQRVIESCKTDLDALPSRTFHDHNLKVTYADNEATLAGAKAESQKVKRFYEYLIEMASGLLKDLESLKQAHPESIEAIQVALDAQARPTTV